MDEGTISIHVIGYQTYQEKHEAYGMLRFSKPWKDRYRSLLSGPKISSAFLRVSWLRCKREQVLCYAMTGPNSKN